MIDIRLLSDSVYNDMQSQDILAVAFSNQAGPVFQKVLPLFSYPFLFSSLLFSLFSLLSSLFPLPSSLFSFLFFSFLFSLFSFLFSLFSLLFSLFSFLFSLFSSSSSFSFSHFAPRFLVYRLLIFSRFLYLFAFLLTTKKGTTNNKHNQIVD